MKTPLRDAPDWLAEHCGWRRINAQNAGSAGLALWQWEPERTQKHLAHRWSFAVLAAWRQAMVDEDTVECQSSALVWLDQQSAAPVQMREEISLLVEPFPTPTWTYFQPWQVAPQTEQLRRLSAMLDESAADAIPLVVEALQPALDKREATLLAACAEMLERTPVAGTMRCFLFLHRVQEEFEHYLDENAARQLNEADRQRGLLMLYKQFDQIMTEFLADWPGQSQVEWLKILLQPWRWPVLANAHRWSKAGPTSATNGPSGAAAGGNGRSRFGLQHAHRCGAPG
jgi:hypothetical protein